MKKLAFYGMLTIILALCTAFQATAIPNEYGSVPGALCKVGGINGGNSANQFDARAIGARNTSTSTNVFVICPFVLTPTPIEGGVVVNLNINAYSVDGQAHDMSCTAVIGSLTRPQEPTYSTKTMSVASSTVTFTWSPDDFNGASSTGGIVGSAWATVTCNLPPQVGVGQTYARLNDTL